MQRELLKDEAKDGKDDQRCWRKESLGTSVKCMARGKGARTEAAGKEMSKLSRNSMGEAAMGRD